MGAAPERGPAGVSSLKLPSKRPTHPPLDSVDYDCDSAIFMMKTLVFSVVKHELHENVKMNEKKYFQS